MPLPREMPIVRRATIADLPAIIEIGSKVYQSTAAQQVRFPGCSPSEYKRYFGDLVNDFFVRKSCSTYVALHNTSTGPKIVGFLIWSKEGFGINDPERPVIRLPDCANKEMQKKWKAADDEWYGKLLAEYGPYYRWCRSFCRRGVSFG